MITNKIQDSCIHLNPMNYAKQSATDALKTTSKRATRKTAEMTGDLICNKIADKITKVLRTSPQNTPETVLNELENIEHNNQIP